MPSDVERHTAQVLDLLSPMQIVAFIVGSLRMGDRIRSHPHPRKTNAAARGNNADLYQMVLHQELFSLVERNPAKVRQIVNEMRASQDGLETLAHGLEQHLPQSDV
jgi:hypothetical protein